LANGYDDQPQELVFDDLPFSQADAVRHKNPEEAYKLGYEQGLQLYKRLNPNDI